MKLFPAKMWKMIPCAVKKFSEEDKLLVKRFPGGVYDDDGRWDEQGEDTFYIHASVQIAKGDELLRLEEGRRTRSALKIYTTTKLHTANVDNGSQPDILEYKDDEYQVDLVDDWSEEGGYYKVLATKVGQ